MWGSKYQNAPGARGLVGAVLKANPAPPWIKRWCFPWGCACVWGGACPLHFVCRNGMAFGQPYLTQQLVLGWAAEHNDTKDGRVLLSPKLVPELSRIACAKKSKVIAWKVKKKKSVVEIQGQLTGGAYPVPSADSLTLFFLSENHSHSRDEIDFCNTTWNLPSVTCVSWFGVPNVTSTE